MAASHSRRALGASMATVVALPLLFSTASQSQASASPLVNDGFDRTTSGLGSTPEGANWHVGLGEQSVTVDGGQAHFDGHEGSVLDAQLHSVSALNTTIQQTVSLPTEISDQVAMAAMTARVDNSNGRSYRMWFNLNASGRVDLHADRTQWGRPDTGIGVGVSAPSLVKPGARLVLKMTVSGSSPTTVTGTVWAEGSPEPAAQFSATDSSPDQVDTAGGVGMVLIGAQGTMPLGVDQFTVTNDSATAPAPLPPAPTASSPAATPTTAPTTTPPTAPAPTAPAPPTASSSPTATAAPTSSAPAPTAPGDPARGSLPVGQASYPVPANAVYVAPAGSDANPGTKEAPKATVAEAVKAAPSGGTVVLRAGVYHQPEVLIQKPVTVQNHPGEAVWFDGSVPVTGWQQEGSVWKAPWTKRWDSSTSFTTGGSNSDFVDPAHPMAAWPDQLYLDGQQLKQVPKGGPIAAGQFAVDYDAQQLITGTDPNGHEMRASDLDRVFTVGSPDVTLRGFGIRRYANSLPRLGVIFTARERNLVENVTIEDIATTGIHMTSDRKSGSGHVNRVTIRRTGLAGVSGQYFDGGKVTNSIISQNNTEKFTPFPATAGVKVTASREVTFDNNLLEDNYNTTGLWTDESVIGVTATRNRITNAQQDAFAGIQLELTSHAVVADNVISGTKRGLYLFDSHDLRVRNNTIWNSVVGDISVDQDFRRQSNPNHNGHDSRNPIPDPENTWVSKNVSIQNNVFGSDSKFSNFQLYVLDKDRAIPAGDMVSSATGNAFEAPGTDAPIAVGWGKLDATVTQYKDIDAWAAAVGRGWVNKSYPTGISPQEAQQHAAGMTHGTPLEADIAQKIGQAEGSRHIGSFQQP
ncbi:right-handed parallel beta-helix repeat-containing protein [Luteococcus sp. Sow4_B9]|uniref:right-handed parallel beta-helix repeat-containing protein n=1 Tax=Luteococcus sp. Sow4_B9 TaxID=3438792 RepID=UPI003F9B3049